MRNSKQAEIGSLPRLFLPEEIATALGCSEWWVKEQARRRLIPFTRTGGGYRFTADHYQEIIRVFEKRPARAPGPDAEEASPSHRRRQQKTTPAEATFLRAKLPRRASRPESARPAA